MPLEYTRSLVWSTPAAAIPTFRVSRHVNINFDPLQAVLSYPLASNRRCYSSRRRDVLMQRLSR